MKRIDYGSIPVLLTQEDIAERVEVLADEIAQKISGEIMVISLLKGSFMFTADLIRELSRIGVHPSIDFLTLSSYGAATESSRDVTVSQDIIEEVKGKNILIVDDIIETGHTLDYAKKMMLEYKAESVKICVLLEKPGKLEKAIQADFVGFRIADKFVVGYGLDYANHYRELPYIGVLEVH